jgi:hypothetical protein
VPAFLGVGRYNTDALLGRFLARLGPPATLAALFYARVCFGTKEAPELPLADHHGQVDSRQAQAKLRTRITARMLLSQQSLRSGLQLRSLNLLHESPTIPKHARRKCRTRIRLFRQCNPKQKTKNRSETSCSDRRRRYGPSERSWRARAPPICRIGAIDHGLLEPRSVSRLPTPRSEKDLFDDR